LVEHRRARTAQWRMPHAVVLRAMHGNRPPLGDAGADAVGALDGFRPDAALPDAPVLELSDAIRIAARIDDDAVRGGKEQRITHLADGGEQAIVVLARERDELLDRRASRGELLRGEDPGRLMGLRVDAIITGAALPRSEHVCALGFHETTVRVPRSGDMSALLHWKLSPQSTGGMNTNLDDRGSRVLGLLDGQRRVLERLATDAPLEDVLVTLVSFIEEQARDMRCAVLLADAEQRRLRFAAAPRFPSDLKKALEPYLKIGPHMAPCGSAAYRKEPVYAADAASYPVLAAVREIALRNGVRAAWSTPILSDDNRVLGTFAMYYGEPRLPTEEHIRLIDMAVQMARVAIEA